MALQNQTFANSGSPYYGNPADWSKFSTLQSTIQFNNTNAKIKVIPAVPDANTTITFNGNQLAYVSDIPDLANWAQYPANHDVDIPSPYALRADTAFISTLTVYQQTTENNINVSSFTASTLQVTNTATISSATASTLQVTNTATINSATINSATITNTKTPLINNSTITITADNPNVLQNPNLNLISKNGSGGRINLTSESGVGFIGGGAINLTANGGTALFGLNGSVDITANAGSSGVAGVTTGGRVNITANSGINDVSLTSAIKLSAAGINIQSGFTSPITSVAGYTFIGGNLGVNSCAGIPSIIPNVAGTNYLYGTNGIVLNSDVYTSDVYPYWNGVTNPADLTINGRTVNVGLGSYNAMVSLNNIKNLAFESSGFRTGGQITGLSSINGLPYSPTTIVSPNLQLSTLTINPTGYISTPNIILSTINDNISVNPVGDIVTFPVSTNILNISTINGQAYPRGSTFIDAYQIYVAPNGNNTTGNGSQQNPYLTIARALTARALISSAVEVSIILSSGTYTESFTLLQNTFLSGIASGEQQQACNIIGNVVLSSAAGQVALSGVQVTAPATGVAVSLATFGGTYSLFNCNITGVASQALNIQGTTSYITECRIIGATGNFNTIAIGVNATTVIFRNTNITASSIANIISCTGNLVMRDCNISNSSINSTTPALIQMGGSADRILDLTLCSLIYTSSTVDTIGNKCCIQFVNTALTYAANLTNCVLVCVGAITGVGGNIQCIQDTGAGLVTLTYGNLLALAPANHIAPTITKTSYVTVP